MTLRARVLAVILLSVCLIISAAFVVTAVRDLSQRRDELISHAALIAAIQAEGLARPLWDLNLPAVNGLIQALSNDADFASAVVMDADGKVVVSHTIAEKIAGGTVAADTPIVIDNGRQRQILGTIQILISTESLWSRAYERVANLVAVLMVTCLSVAVAVMLAFRRIAQPLARIAVATERLASGDGMTPVPETHRGDEIGNIARAVERSRQQMAMIDQLRLEQANHLRIVFEGAVDAIVVTDVAYRIEMVNPAAERIFAASVQQLTGRSLLELIPSLAENAHDHCQSRGACSEADGVRSDGETVPLAVSVSSFTLGSQPKLSVILHDISEHRNAERALVAAREAAEEANRTKSSFLANMSHEIRTPMNAIIGMTRMAVETRLTGKQRNYLGKVVTAAQGLLAIINDILDLSKIEADKLVLESIPFRLDDLLGELADLTTIRAREKELELLFDVSPDLPMSLMGDPVRLKQILLNLIGNAVKFTDHGEIVVVAEQTGESNGLINCRFSVRDTGAGMTEEERNRLFLAFSQADVSTTRKYGGTGLGLAISKRLVELMDGEISVESSPGKGSTFSFTVSFAVPSPESATMGTRRWFKGSRVLVVDDNSTSLDILSSTLASFKFDVAQAQSGGQALVALDAAAAAGRPFNLVLMDYMMPGIDGIEAATRIKADKRLTSTPTVIMVTAYGREEIRQRASEAGIDRFLVKPVTPSILMDTIQDVFAGEADAHLHQRPTQEQQSKTVSATLASLVGSRILLVEDNAVNAELASEFLANRGFLVQMVSNGEEAIRILESQAFDGVLMDCQMPVMDGYEATRRLRRNPAFHGLPIIAMTANAMRGDREKCLEAGMDDYVAKPFDEVELLTVLGKWVRPAVPAGPTVRIDGRQGEDAGGAEVIDRLTSIDVTRGLSHAGGDRKLFLRLLRRFHDGQLSFAETFRRTLIGPDTSEPLRLVHTLKGLAGTLGAVDLQRHAAALEAAMIAAGDEAERDCLFDRASAALTVVLDDISACLKTATVVTPAMPVVRGEDEYVDLAGMLGGLRQLLSNSDTACGEALDAIFRRWPLLRDRFGRVADLTAQYRFDEALSALEMIDMPQSLLA